jgi:hypothetical protein
VRPLLFQLRRLAINCSSSRAQAFANGELRSSPRRQPQPNTPWTGQLQLSLTVGALPDRAFPVDGIKAETS